jgi:hypothetical protein
MTSKFRTAVAVTLLVASTAVVRAQPAVAPVSAAPPASAASRSAMGYRSAFEGYRSFKDQPVQSWREANDLVGHIGGWQAYAREGQGGPPAGSVPGASGSASATSMPGMPGMRMPSSAPSAPRQAASQSMTGHKMP